jgi:hypothetical protein
MEKPDCLEKYLQEIVLEESTKDDKHFFLKARKMLEDLKSKSKEKICLIKKALYGLKQAGRQWFQKLDAKLKEFGFKSSEADPCIYIYCKGGEKLIVAVYVDDLIIASSSDAELKKLKQKIMESFDM